MELRDVSLAPQSHRSRRLFALAAVLMARSMMGCPSGSGGDGSAEGDAGTHEHADGSMAMADPDDEEDPDDEGTADASVDDREDASVDEREDASTGMSGDRPFEGNGISALVDGERITFTETVVLFPNNSGNGLIMLEAGAANGLSKWRVFVPGELGTYACDDAVEETVLQLIDTVHPDVSGSASGEGGCTMTVTEAAEGVYSGTFEGVLEGLNGSRLTVTDGWFHYDPFSGPSGGEEGVGESEPGASFELDGDTWSYATASLWPFETFAAITVAPAPSDNMSPGFPLGIQLHSLPNEPGTYACGEGASYRAVNVWFWWKGDWYYAGNRQAAEPQGPEGSSCTITLTQTGTIDGSAYHGTLAGTFSGTFVTNDGAKSIAVTNGHFLGIGQ